jgi:hypothetical protein
MSRPTNGSPPGLAFAFDLLAGMMRCLAGRDGGWDVRAPEDDSGGQLRVGSPGGGVSPSVNVMGGPSSGPSRSSSRSSSHSHAN